jgi:cytoskeletal protein RodZ
MLTMAALGTDLRQIREERNVSLGQMAQDTRISSRHFQSLEEGRINDLPGGIYNRAFLRAYCEYLGVDPTEFLRRYESETGSVPDRPVVRPAQPIKHDFSPSRSHPLAIWTAGLLVSVAGLYFSRHWIASVFSPYFSRPAPTSLAVNVKPLQVVPVQLEPAANKTAAPATPSAASLEAQAVPPAEAVASETLQGKFVLTVEVVDDCWVSLDSDGNRVLVRLLKPGEGHSYAADQRFFLVLGNAAGVHLKINGQPLKPLGKPGSVVKLMITEQNLQELLAKATS